MANDLRIPYRDESEGLQRRLVKLRAEHEQRLLEVDTLGPLAAARWARIGFGLAGSLGALAIVVLGVVYRQGLPYTTDWLGHGIGLFTAGLVACWVAALGGWVVGWGLGILGWQLGLRGEERPHDELNREIARLEQGVALFERRARRIDRMETASLALPMAAVSLLMPLTLHLMVAALFGSLRGFDEWMGISLLVVGHAHLVLVGLTVQLAWSLRRADPVMCGGRGWSILWTTVVAAALPGILILALPPLITAVTGALFIPGMCKLACRVAERERAELRVPVDLSDDAAPGR